MIRRPPAVDPGAWLSGDLADLPAHQRTNPLAKALRSWHLAMLRFAITRDNADRLGVLAIANEIDRLNRPHADKADFSFFRGTSTDICNAIEQPSQAGKAVLDQYRARIEDERLARAFAASLDIEAQPVVTARPRSRTVNDLWRGLSPRNAARR